MLKQKIKYLIHFGLVGLVAFAAFVHLRPASAQAPAAYSISGTVLGYHGGPLEMADLELVRNNRLVASAVTGPTGAYRFEAVEPGDYTIRVAFESCSEIIARQDITVDQDLVLNYQAQRSGGMSDCLPQGQPELAGVVTDADTGLPIEGARVRMFLRADPSISIETTSAADGSYSMDITPMPAGFYLHEASKAGYRTATRSRWYGGVGSTMDFELRAEQTGVIVEPIRVEFTLPPDRTRDRGIFLRNFTAETIEWSVEESGGERVSAYFPNELPLYQVFLPAMSGSDSSQSSPPEEDARELQAVAEVPWLQVSPSSGTLSPDSSERLVIFVDTHGLESGIYEATLLVHTSSSETPELQVRVRLTVTRPGGGS